ncbi:MAG: hypothetical protein OXO50_18035 [Caldilineaceae bacterium]|nr:hypothetical protein [Caldilineaceae bacterium]
MPHATGTERTQSREEELPVSKTPLFELSRQAGELALTMQQDGLRSIHTKSTPNDLVTEADLACETLIRDRLASLTPDFGFWGEESDERPHDENYWLVDPIDGTINFAAGLPWFGINIALIEDNNAAEFARIMPICRGVRRMGASSADLAYVASGTFSAYWEGWIKPWDVAAGVLLVREAGGQVTNYEGAPYGLDDHCIIASNGQPGVHEPLLHAIQEARSEKFDQDRRKG